jgi:AcrR family transcriptional regulator
VYRHFEDKTSLLAAIAQQGYEQVVERMRSAQAEAPPELEEQLHAAALAYVTYALEQPAHFGVMSGPRLNRDGRFPELERAAQEGYAQLLTLLQRAKRERGFKGRPEHGVVALWAAVYGIASLNLQGRIPIERNKLAKFTRKVLAPTIRGLLG